MEIIDFYPKRFGAIPKQDNPAFSDAECLMIVGDGKEHSQHAVVLHIRPDPIESVNSVADFFRHEKAVEYCNLLQRPTDA